MDAVTSTALWPHFPAEPRLPHHTMPCGEVCSDWTPEPPDPSAKTVNFGARPFAWVSENSRRCRRGWRSRSKTRVLTPRPEQLQVWESLLTSFPLRDLLRTSGRIWPSDRAHSLVLCDTLMVIY